jgi:hypothetical protein
MFPAADGAAGKRGHNLRYRHANDAALSNR